MVESRQTAALAVVVLFAVLAFVFVAARTYSRYLGRNFGWDDWLIHLSFLLFLGETIVEYKFIILSRTGFHSRDLPKQTIAEQVEAAKWSFAVQMFYHPMMGAIRASIIMFLFRVKDKRLHIQTALHMVFWINMGYMVSTTFVNIFQCTPIRYAYMRAEMDQDGTKNGKCIDSLAFIMSSCALSIFMDLIIIPIPTAMVWNLQMQRKTKIAVVAIMSMGWIATSVSVARLIIYYYRFLPSNTDRTWDIGLVVSIVEPSVGIIAACAPAMKCLFRNLMPRYFSDDGTSYPARTQSNKSAPRQSLSYHFGMDKEMAPARLEGLEREEETYGMRPLGSVDSREQFAPTGPPRPVRTRSVKTGHSEASMPLEAVPKHILNRDQ